MKIIIDEDDILEVKKLGFSTLYFGGASLAYVDDVDAMDYLRQKHAADKASDECQKRERLTKKRESIADDQFEAYRFDKENAEIVDHEGWETDGPDRLIKKIFWTATDEEWDTSKLGQFTVDFKPGTAKIVEAYPNL